MSEVYLDECIEDFLGGDKLPVSFREYISEYSEVIRQRLYRGLPFPLKQLEVGNIIEEWGGSTHWSYNEGVALDFASNCCGNDEVPLVLYAKGLKGFDIAPYLESTEVYDEYAHEEEVTVVGKDFKILSIYTEMYRGKIHYFAKVKPVKRKTRESCRIWKKR